MVAPHAIDTENPTAVAEAIKAVFAVAGGQGSFSLIERAVSDVEAMFEKGWHGYQPIDMEYHDLDHTFQVTICMLHLLQGRMERGVEPVLGIDDWELAILAALLHDTGFLKEQGDDVGTGAKYTFVHEKRSCAFAHKYLKELGLEETKIVDVCSAVMCTGPRNKIVDVEFQRDEARRIALLLVTADYLAQMSAADYLEKLPRLYLEFLEAFEHEGVPAEKRPYQSVDQLLEMTGGFWRNFVMPLLEGDTEGVYHYLSPEGSPNPYLIAIEENIAELERRLQAQQS
ncbi:MAG: hypothetical protein ACSHX9_03915 [Luteolibacter sp.]